MKSKPPSAQAANSLSEAITITNSFFFFFPEMLHVVTAHSIYKIPSPLLYKWWHILCDFGIFILLIIYIKVIFYHIWKCFCIFFGATIIYQTSPLLKAISAFLILCCQRQQITLYIGHCACGPRKRRLFFILLWHLSLDFAYGSFCHACFSVHSHLSIFPSLIHGFVMLLVWRLELSRTSGVVQKNSLKLSLPQYAVNSDHFL